ncbi:MAG TPA: carboxypeptidase-like regulatory domain-containing protein [Vicinamibacterales bacterium]|jgi:Carboxypeptidase regulatory-like domain|nr:carboxypeptidase-like regulatory domain-containing protein [Vicinamibacterales bacterium]
MRRIILIGIGVFMLAGPAAATDLRGRVDARNNYSSTPFPVAGTAVSLYREEGGQRRMVQSAYTAPNGMYYFSGVAPGKYTLQVERYRFHVEVGNARLQDLRPVVIAR